MGQSIQGSCVGKLNCRFREKIAAEKHNLTKVMDLVSIKKGDTTEFKEKLSKEELLAAVELMKTASDVSDIADKMHEIKIAKEIRRVLDRAKEKALEKDSSESQ